jgi:hypothetical protein
LRILFLMLYKSLTRVMRQNGNSQEDAGYKARVARLFADDASRIKAAQVVIGAALFSGVLLSLNLWLPLSRTFPRAPLINVLPQAIVPTVEYLLSAMLMLALIILVFAKRRAKHLPALITFLLVALISLDQMRLQPWVYQYLLLFAVIALHRWQRPDEQSARLSLSILQLIIATVYFWSGVQKLNYSFSQEVLPQLLAPLQISLTQRQLFLLGLGLAGVEIFTGCGLLFKKTRRHSVCLALTMHAVILGLLVALGYNTIVWAWNASLMLIVVVLFRRSDASIGQAFINWRERNAKQRTALALAILCALLPALSFVGWWDMYLSGALYSGNTAVAVVRVDAAVYEKLPERAKLQVFKTKSGEQMLPLFEWSMAELNVPPYPELRVYKQLTRATCGLAENPNQLELIMKTSPGILDGGYQVKRMNCSQLEE